jgi:hypothetical protein
MYIVMYTEMHKQCLKKLYSFCFIYLITSLCPCIHVCMEYCIIMVLCGVTEQDVQSARPNNSNIPYEALPCLPVSLYLGLAIA